MRFTPRTWSLLSLMLFVAAIFFWLKGNEYQERLRQDQPAAPVATNEDRALELMSPGSTGVSVAALRVPGLPGLPDQYRAPGLPEPDAAASEEDERHPYRLRNTSRSIAKLAQDDHAILMANAFIDTTENSPVIPEHLQNEGDPGTYIVQWHTAPDARFRALLADQQAAIVSYVPNNAYLVRASGAAATTLRGLPGVAAVLPYEPYYKLDSRLLEAAVDNARLDADLALRLTFFPDAAETGLAEVRGLHARVLAQEPSPFGPQAIIRPPVDALPELARLASVQAIEPVFPRKLANDLTRVSVGISPDPVTNHTYMNLRGSNIWVNMNDTGVDVEHGDLEDRVTLGHPSLQNNDPDGHGTFVAAILAGSGEESDSVDSAPGSLPDSNYRGMAPEAQIFALPLQNGEDVYAHVLDSYLYETAARTNYITLNRTNTLISNNSWTYLGAVEYDSSAARYDAAVRDSIPGQTGEQPVLFIFAAGNGGLGDENGLGGLPGSVFSPATAKNVITVGALEHPRFIEIGYTNEVIVTNNPGPDQIVITNEEVVFPYFELTDSADEVASYSSRGNVGIGTEGFFGRFKPDLVAPGTMIISAKSEGFNLEDQIDTTNEPGATFESLHEGLGEYRIDSGTTYAAPVVSGLLALIQEFYQYHAPEALRRDHLSPALMKAILINGARSLTANYDLQVRTLVNYQGWGIPNIQRSIPTNLVVADESKWSMRLVDQHPTNALSTGQSRTWNVTLTTNASAYPLRATLVWTDPPGNPAVAVKLVNDLDLIVTNLESGAVFFGNNIPGGSDFTRGLDPEDESYDPVAFLDNVNNVENVFVLDPSDFGREFSITVRAKRVNVNSVQNYHEVTGNTNDVVQDFALVISSDVDLEDQDVFEEFTADDVELASREVPLTIVTNGLPLLEQRVGANASLVGPNGVTNQWSFYVFTNVYIENSLVNITNGSNVAFVTFNPPELARPRNFEADVDVYVSDNPQLTNLVPSVIDSAFKSVGREGTEMVVFTNAAVGADSIFYVAVKAEDQQGAEFSLIGISTELPFDEDQDGNRIIRGFPFSSFIPDGSPRRPGANMVMGIGLSNKRVQRITATNVISHENMGDLLGVLSHGNRDVVLNNHNLSGGVFFGTNTFVYDDFFLASTTDTIPTDGPGSLNSFAGQKIVGPWMLQMIDNAPGFTGRVELLTLKIEPLRDDLLPGVATEVKIGASNIVYYPVDVPPGVTNVIFEISEITPAGSRVEAFFRRDLLPTFTEYDLKATNIPPATEFTFSYPTRTSPPLAAGTYFLGLYNPNAQDIEFTLLMTFEYGFDPNNESRNTLGDFDLRDNATTNVVLDLTADKVITSTEVGVRLDHPRISDLVLHLVSPQGTRVLLAENRGLTDSLGFGTSYVVTNGSNNVTTNYGYTYFTEDTNLTQVPIKFAPLPFNSLPTNFGVIFTNGFEGARASNYVAGSTVAGWQVGGTNRTLTNGFTIQPMVSIITGTNYAHGGTNLLSLGSGLVRRTLSLEAGKSYQLRFAYRTAEPLNFVSTGLDLEGDPLEAGEVDPHYFLVSSPNAAFPGPEAYVIDPRNSTRVFSHWAFTTDESQWIAPYPSYSTVEPGTYVFRQYLSLYGLDTRTAQIQFKWSADDTGEVMLNGSFQDDQPITPLLFHTSTKQVIINGFRQAVAGFRQGLNILDFHVEDTNLVTGLRVETLEVLPARDLSNSSFTVNFNGQAQTLRSGNGWITRTINFVAASDTEVLEFSSGEGEVWIDTVEVIGTGDSFVLPEETLTLLEGERAYGEWRLEVTDSRTGAIIPNPEMLSWKLNLTFAEPLVYGEHLRSGVTYPTRVTQWQRPGIRPGVLFTNHIHYFIVETCPDTTEARITLTGVGNVGGIEMWVDHTGFPTFDPTSNDYVVERNTENAETGNGVAEFFINTSSPAAAPLRPGKPLFIAVRNLNRSLTNVYNLRATLDAASCQGTQAVSSELSEDEPVTSMIAAAEPPESEGELFEVEVPEASGALTFHVEADGDVAFAVRMGLPPTRSDYTYFQDTPGSGSESLTIPASALAEGDWYILVLNNDTRPITYQITASFEDGEAPLVTARLAAGQIILEWAAEAGASYRVESSTDLENWSVVTTVEPAGSVGTYSAPVSTEVDRFYRVVRLP